MTDLKTEKTSMPGHEKAPYNSPNLTAYGSLQDRTRGGAEFGNDGNTECTGNADSATTPCIS